jgi:hypothetical protein
MPDGIKEQFIQYDNSGIVAQEQMTMGANIGLRLPEFDIDVTSEKANPYKKMEINELALAFYNNGFFNPQMTDQALACLNMMDFTKKEDVVQKIQENGTLAEMLVLYQQMALQFANQINPLLGEQVANQILQQSGQPIPQGMGTVSIGDGAGGEPAHMEKARSTARQSTQAD